MKVRLEYSPLQLEECVKFISTHNESFLGREDFIRTSIQGNMMGLAQRFPHGHNVSTMGYTIQAYVEEIEGIDHDHNILRFEFLVNPAVSIDDYKYITEDIKIETK